MMIDYQKEYQKKLVSAEEAVKIVRSGDWLIKEAGKMKIWKRSNKIV